MLPIPYGYGVKAQGLPCLISMRNTGVDGCVISAVDLIKGIGIFAGLEIIEVEGATGSLNTNFEGKAQAAIDAYRRGKDFVYLHLECTDECSHQGSLEKKDIGS